jgi:hypothetical protein
VDNAFATNISYSAGHLTFILYYNPCTLATTAAKRGVQGRNISRVNRTNVDLLTQIFKKKFLSFKSNHYISGKPVPGFEPATGSFKPLLRKMAQN